jgi:AraC family transcriptional regulator
MYVKTETRPAFEVVGMKYRGKNEVNEVPELWEAFVPRMGEIKNRVDLTVSYGVMDNYDEDSGDFDYIACVEVAPDGELPEGMVRVKVPELTYAVFKAKLPTIKEAFGQIYQEWFPSKGFRRSPGPEFELYNREFEVDKTIYIYMPIQTD